MSSRKSAPTSLLKTSKPINASNDEKPIYVPKPPLFLYPALPPIEIAFYFLVVLSSITYAYVRIYQASRAYTWDPKKEWWSEYKDIQWPFNLGTFRKDVTDDEWSNWSKYACQALPWFFGHFLIFNVFEKLFPSFCSQQSHLWSKILLAYWLLAHCFLFGTIITGFTLGQGLILYIFAWKFRSRVALWVFAILLLYPSMNNPIIIPPDGNEFLAITLMSYKVLHFLSYTLDMLQDDGETKHKYTFLEMITLAFYLPYSISLIVISKDIRRQLSERKSKNVQWKATLFFGLRILFWYCLAELSTYVFYIQALMNDPGELKRLRKDVLVNVGMAVAQFFHLKYVVIFGLPAFFARMDGMQPQQGPICVSRLTIFSKIWRFFDRGLYAWFKEYIYLPLCRPTFSVWRKLSALIVVYSFVLLWHGTSHDYFVWVVLSMCEIFIEQISKFVYTLPSVRRWRENRISDRNFRRILAWCQVLTFAFGLYSNFYFLGSSEAGYVFVERIFWQETVTVKWPFILLICLGYCQSHVSMEVDRLQSERNEKEKKTLGNEQKKKITKAD